MAFSFFEGSRSKSKPFYLYTIRYGAGINEVYTFTDSEFPVTVNGVEYLPRQMTHSEISTTGTLDKSSVEISTPRTNELFELFRSYPPSYRVTVTIMKSHYGDADQGRVTIWVGRIIGMSVRGEECSFNCDPITTTSKRIGLRRNWQYGCPHALYKPGCNASKSAVQKTATVVDKGAGTLTLSADWNGDIGASKFIGGYVEIPALTTLARTILRVSGNLLTIAGSIDIISIGDTVTLYPGCAHSMADCKNLHNNIVNFGGQPWIPSDNPIGSKNNFY